MTNGSSRREFLARSGMTAGGVLFSGTVGGALLGGSPAAATAAPWDQIPAILRRTVPPTFPDRTVDIRDHGAQADGSTDCTAAFRNAIAACNGAGGGRVL